VYAGPVNYQTAAGSWLPIDPALVAGQDGRWHEKASSPGTAGRPYLQATFTVDSPPQIDASYPRTTTTRRR
jgi:hypothetical protein